MSVSTASSSVYPGAINPASSIAPGQPAANPASRAPSRRPAPVAGATRPAAEALTAPASNRRATDDEILGIGNELTSGAGTQDPDGVQAPDNLSDTPESSAAEIPEGLRAALDANPELREVWDDAQAYRETFATPEAARAAVAQLADLDRLDALFFSRRPEDHAALARAVASLDPASFASLAQAMAALAGNQRASRENSANDAVQAANASSPASNAAPTAAPAVAPTNAQVEFFHAANEASVRGVIEAIESQVERLLPEGVSKSARNRVVGEIYRELDNSLRSNRQLGEQMRQAFRSGALDSAHQRAIVSLVTGRARQALPAVARRVLSEWTSTLVAANQDRRARQRAAERRVDIAGSSGGNDGRRSMIPRDLDYARLSDSDILNL